MKTGEPSSSKGPGLLSRAWFELLLLSFPPDSRRRFGDSMRETFDLRYRERRDRGPLTLLSFFLKTGLDMPVSGSRERLRRPGPHVDSPAGMNLRSKHPLHGMKRTPMENLRQDLVFAFRSLSRNPLFSLAVLVTLALGIGATTSIFSVVNGVLLKPLPFQDPDRLVSVFAAPVDYPTARGNMSGPDMADLARTGSMETVVGYADGMATLTGRGDARLVFGARISRGLLSTFGLEPFMGRDLTPEESIPGSSRSVVIGFGFWQQEFGGRNDVLGQTLELDGESYEVVGVAPQGFEFPRGARLWRPYYRTDEGCGRGCHVYDAVARLAPGATLEQARQEAEALALRLEEEFPDLSLGKRFNLMSLEEDFVGEVRTELWILLSAVGLVLLVACANVANLLLARGQGRTGEVGIRAAMGAGRGRLLQQVLTESLVLALLGGALGVGLTFLGVRILKGMAPASLPRVEEIAVDPAVLVFALLLSGTVALIFGLSPALKLVRTSPAEALGRSRRGGDAGRAGSRSRSLLLAGEVALSLILLTAAGLLLRTLTRISEIQPGYRTEQITRFTLSLPRSAYPELEQMAGFFETLEDRLEAIPGVESVGSAFGAPLGSTSATGTAHVEGQPEALPGEEIQAQMRPITPGYLETMGISILKGRGIQDSDRAGGVEVALINETLARALFPGEDPLGRQVRVTVSFGFGFPYRTVVGVVADTRNVALTREPKGGFYVPQRQAGPRYMTVAVRSRPGMAALAENIRREVVTLDPNIPLRDVETMARLVSEEMAPTRFVLTLLAVFAGLALALAAVGLYGVAAYMVSQRRREIGIRMALGARSSRVTGMVIRQAALPTFLGVGIGLAASLLGADVMRRLLYEVDPRDPWVFTGVAVLLVVVSLLATLLPARQAARVDPGEALRRE